MISLRPSTTRRISSGETRPIRLLRRLTDNVRTWPTLTHERLGSPPLTSSTVRGKPTFCAWLVIAMPHAVPGGRRVRCNTRSRLTVGELEDDSADRSAAKDRAHFERPRTKPEYETAIRLREFDVNERKKWKRREQHQKTVSDAFQGQDASDN